MNSLGFLIARDNRLATLRWCTEFRCFSCFWLNETHEDASHQIACFASSFSVTSLLRQVCRSTFWLQMLEDGEVVIFSLEGGTAKPLRSFHAEATCHQSCIFRVCRVSTKLICLTIAVHGGLPRRTWPVSPSTHWPKASLCRPQSVHWRVSTLTSTGDFDPSWHAVWEKNPGSASFQWPSLCGDFRPLYVHGSQS